MINKDNPNSFLEEDTSHDEQIYYIPRVASGNGKKRGAILASWTIPRDRMWENCFNHIIVEIYF